MITEGEGRPLLFCSRVRSLTRGVVRDGHSLFDIIEQQDGLTERALEAHMHTGGFVVGELRILPLKSFEDWGFTLGQLNALIEADLEAKDRLVNCFPKQQTNCFSADYYHSLRQRW